MDYSKFQKHLNNHQRFQKKLEADHNKFPISHHFGRFIDGFIEHSNKIAIGSILTSMLAAGSVLGAAYYYSINIEEAKTKASSLIQKNTDSIQEFGNSLRYQKNDKNDAIYVPFDENFYNTLNNHNNTEQEVLVQSPFEKNQTIYYYTPEMVEHGHGFELHDAIEKENAIGMSRNRAWASNFKWEGYNLISSEYSDYYVLYDDEVDVDFTNYIDVQNLFIIFHEFAHTHFIQEISRVNFNEEHGEQINESHADVSAIISVAKYFDLDYPTFYEVAKGLHDFRAENAVKSKSNSHNTTQSLGELISISPEEYEQLKEMKFSDIPFFAHDWVMISGINHHHDFTKKDLKTAFDDFKTDNLQGHEVHSLMRQVKNFLNKQEDSELKDTLLSDIENVLEKHNTFIGTSKIIEAVTKSQEEKSSKGVELEKFDTDFLEEISKQERIYRKDFLEAFNIFHKTFQNEFLVINEVDFDQPEQFANKNKDTAFSQISSRQKSKRL